MRYSTFINDTLKGRTGINWSYYRIHIAAKDVISPAESREFIRQYFEAGAKELPLVLDPVEANKFFCCSRYCGKKCDLFQIPAFENHDVTLPDDRATHTVSGFFLGLLIENCLTGGTPLGLRDPLLLPFSYLWFLTFLYHDYGYCITEREHALLQAPARAPIPISNDLWRSKAGLRFEYAKLKQVKRGLGINASLFSPSWNPSYRYCRRRNCCAVRKNARCLGILIKEPWTMFKNSGLRFNTGTEIRRHRYTSTDTIRYFNYCINVWGKIDHGITGGFLFYDRMVKNYISAYFSAIKESPDLSRDEAASFRNFTYMDKHFCIEQLPVFLHIAGCIAAHNIWKQSEDQREAYERYLLDVLLAENYKNITFEEDPLLYILALTDTLEPTKIYNQQKEYQKLTAREVANSIDVDYTPGTRKIRFSASSNIRIDPLYKKAKGLEGWTSAKCSMLGENAFEIFI